MREYFIMNKHEIELAVENFLSGPDLNYEEIKNKYGNDYMLETIAMRMNFLKHRHFRRKENAVESQKLFNQMCNIIPGFMLMEKNDV